MTPEQIEQMKADREAGTDGPWEAALERGCHGVIAHVLPEGGANFVAMVGNDAETEGKEPCRFANARRIARVPDLEAEVLRLREALERVGESSGSDTCSYSLTYGKLPCDCHLGIARAALKGGSHE